MSHSSHWKRTSLLCSFSLLILIPVTQFVQRQLFFFWRPISTTEMIFRSLIILSAGDLSDFKTFIEEALLNSLLFSYVVLTLLTSSRDQQFSGQILFHCPLALWQCFQGPKFIFWKFSYIFRSCVVFVKTLFFMLTVTFMSSVFYKPFHNRF